MTLDIVDCWLEAETALGFRTFYTAHLSTVQTVMVVPSLSPLILNHIVQTYAVCEDFLMQWHSIYHPHTVRGLMLPQQHIACIAADLLPLLTPRPALTVKWLFTPNPSMTARPPVPAEPDYRIRRCLSAALTALREWEADEEESRAIGPVGPWVERYLTPKDGGPAHNLHFFGSPLTGSGPDVTFLTQQFSDLHTTIHVQSNTRRTTSQFLRRFAEQALIQGFTVWIYHDTLDPYLIDHLILPKLSLGLTSARPPHFLNEGKTTVWLNDLVSPTPRSAHWWKIFQISYTRAWQAIAKESSRRQLDPMHEKDVSANVLSDQNFSTLQ